MKTKQYTFLAATFLALTVTSACSEDDCSRNSDCSVGQVCDSGSCRAPQTDPQNNDSPNNDDNNTSDCTPSVEICDGIDNNCDFLIDNEVSLASCPELPNAEPNECAVGRCRYTCLGDAADINGDLNARESDGCECVPTDDPTDICDSIDNDCDGEIDENAILNTCPAIPNAEAASCMQGECLYFCAENAADLNEDLNTPDSDGCECVQTDDPTEQCDGIDNDCDGLIDDSPQLATCPPIPNAQGIECVDAQCIYECAEGFGDANGDLNQAEGDGCECVRTEDATEVCDGIDNDCNGEADDGVVLPEGCPALDGAVATACEAGECVYQCLEGFFDTDGDLNAEGSNGCECAPTDDATEICDGQDNDCNGDIDAADANFVPSPCELDLGVCQGAVALCVDGLDVACNEADYIAHNPAFASFPDQLELVCDGQDNNCNGDSDENCCPNGFDGLLVLQPVNNTDSAVLPAIAANDDLDLFFVAWQEANASDDDDVEDTGTIRYMLTDISGATVFGTIDRITSTPPVSDIQPAVAWDGEAFVLTWVREDLASQLRWRRISPTGEQLGEALLVSSPGLEIRDAHIEGKENGDTVVMWSQSGGCDNEQAVTCVRAMTVNREGTPSAQTELSPDTGAINPRAVSFILDEDGSGMALWHDNALTRLQVVWNRFDAQLQPLDDGDSASLDDRVLTVQPRMIKTPTGYMIAYANLQAQTMQIHTQRVNAQGQPDGDAQAITAEGEDKIHPVLADFGDNQLKLIYAQERSFSILDLDSDGLAVGEPSVLIDGYRSGFRPQVLISAPGIGAIWLTSNQLADLANNRERVFFHVFNSGAERLCIEP